MPQPDLDAIRNLRFFRKYFGTAYVHLIEQFDAGTASERVSLFLASDKDIGYIDNYDPKMAFVEKITKSSLESQLASAFRSYSPVTDYSSEVKSSVVRVFEVLQGSKSSHIYFEYLPSVGSPAVPNLIEGSQLASALLRFSETLAAVHREFEIDIPTRFVADERRASCCIPDDHISPRRSALFMARSVLRELRDGVRPC